ncbi:UNVERIFIED_CONTAM: Centromere protein C [Sesamum calycinum]|uniref:Centromere protein C n=1 Tax=Sesamum calycinum TaxID=2727403 RepID=A0AAW2NHM3_9LAMI
MASEASLSDSVDPLRGISLSTIRTIRPSADVPVPVDPKDLDSIHNFMKSLELRSPEKLMNEAKRIVDGGAEFLESKLGNFAKNVGITDANAAKGKDVPQERRPGLRLDRKRAKFSLKTSVSQPSVSLEPTLNIDQLHDPDEFFDAYERMENAKKEIQKQLGGSIDNVNLYEPLNTARSRRPGILGKSYNYKHRYSSEPSENDMLMASQNAVDQDIPSAPEGELQEKLVHPDPDPHPNPNPDPDLEEVEPAVSMKKTDNEVSDILEELLSCNNEDLEGDGALNLLQEKLKIKPLDLGNLYITDLPDGRTNISTVTESLQKPCRSSLVIDSVLKKLTMKSPVANPV